ncbi:MAG: hypothetical protein PGMFKBFP_03174 [Anaerolineales bacterium]|nr:hypothetical protein [Anaerolineales bacterium]
MDSIQSVVDLMLEQPEGWLYASLPILLLITCEIFRLRQTMRGGISFDEARAIIQRKYWLDQTGIESVNSRFTIVVPIHNERRFLPSFLGAFLASGIPSDVDAQIVFVLNASADQSKEILIRRLSQYYPAVKIFIPNSAYDPKMSNSALQFGYTGLRFLIVETPTAGKANALNIGNEIAIRSDHPLAINIDANNWVEPDSVARLYGFTRRVILDDPKSDTVLVNSQEFSPKKNENMRATPRAKTMKAEVTGWMFAWSTHWINGIKGFPQNVIEDYSAGLIARSQGRQIAESDAKIWGYAASTLFDENKEMIRYIYGAMQLMRQFEGNALARSILLDDFPQLRSLKNRISYFLFRKQDRGQPLKYVKGVIRWLKNEWFISQARREMRYAPHGQTWRPISSTK